MAADDARVPLPPLVHLSSSRGRLRLKWRLRIAAFALTRLNPARLFRHGCIPTPAATPTAAVDSMRRTTPVGRFAVTSAIAQRRSSGGVHGNAAIRPSEVTDFSSPLRNKECHYEINRPDAVS